MKIHLLQVKRTIGEEIKYQIEDLFRTFTDFFIMIKENTYDVLCENFGADIINLFFIAGGALLIMIVALAIINR